MKRRWPEIDLYLNPLMWEWRTFRFDHCTIYHRGPITVAVYKGWAAWTAR